MVPSLSKQRKTNAAMNVLRSTVKKSKFIKPISQCCRTLSGEASAKISCSPQE